MQNTPPNPLPPAKKKHLRWIRKCVAGLELIFLVLALFLFGSAVINKPLFSSQAVASFFIFIFGYPCGLQDASSSTRDWTGAVIHESTESIPLDHQGSPAFIYKWKELG